MLQNISLLNFSPANCKYKIFFLFFFLACGLKRDIQWGEFRRCWLTDPGHVCFHLSEVTCFSGPLSPCFWGTSGLEGGLSYGFSLLMTHQVTWMCSLSVCGADNVAQLLVCVEWKRLQEGKCPSPSSGTRWPGTAQPTCSV